MKKRGRAYLMAVIARLTRERDEAREAGRAALERDKMARADPACDQLARNELEHRGVEDRDRKQWRLLPTVG